MPKIPRFQVGDKNSTGWWPVYDSKFLPSTHQPLAFVESRQGALVIAELLNKEAGKRKGLIL